MAEILGGIQRGLGMALNAIYEVIPSYALAIILLTIVVRALLVPITVKQVKSMQSMQKLAPEQKKIQAKYKELQKKVTDRAEVQQLRMQMNQEVQALFKHHGVNPLGGCLPMLAQMPVYIGMFSIMRAVITALPAVALVVAPGLPTAGSQPSHNIPADTFSSKDLKQTVCTPTKSPTAEGPSPSEMPPLEIECRSPGGGEPKRFVVDDLAPQPGRTAEKTYAWIASCRPGVREDDTSTAAEDESETLAFVCASRPGTGHLPKDGKLFRDVTTDSADLIPGMHAGCTASQAASKVRILECSARESDGGGARSIPYYLLIVGIMASQYYQGKQMLKRATGPQADTQRTMMKFMPVIIGFVSMNIPAGANLYFVVSNLWTIGQQHILLAKKDEANAALGDGPGSGKASKDAGSKNAAAKALRASENPTPKPKTNGASAHSRSKKKKKKRK